VNTTFGVRGDLVTIGDEQYLKVRHVYVVPEVGDLKFYASNLFIGDDALSEYRQLPHASFVSMFCLPVLVFLMYVHFSFILNLIPFPPFFLIYSSFYSSTLFLIISLLLVLLSCFSFPFSLSSLLQHM
jgi:hypothetical protein